MKQKVYIVTDLGPGDGGKGGVVHKVATLKRAHTIVKVGGAQGSHGVCTAKGERFAFSQWGCATFEGVKTHLSNRIVISPDGLLNEADTLRYEHGVHDPFGMLTVDETALCATPYHGIASRIREMARGDKPRGTIGTGVGDAYRMAERCPELVIRARDLARPNLRDLLAAVRKQVQLDLAPILQGGFLPEDAAAVQDESRLLNDDEFLAYAVRRFGEVAERATIVDHEFLGRSILSQDGVVVVESSHGILTDHYQGFHPHTSAIRTLPRFTRAMLDEAGYGGEVVSLGVTRAYGVRHGAGPMPTADPSMAERLLPGSHKIENRYQGKVRVGSMDMVLLRYSIAVAGGREAFDGLAVTWFDQVQTNGAWHVCHRYQEFGDLPVRFGEDETQLAHQQALGQRLQGCTPEISTYDVLKSAGRDQLYELCAGVLQESLGVRVRMVAFGPKPQDKSCK